MLSHRTSRGISGEGVAVPLSGEKESRRAALRGMTGLGAASALANSPAEFRTNRVGQHSSAPLRSARSKVGAAHHDRRVARPQLLCELVIVAGLLFVYDRVAEMV